jgi:hypothetical protein
MAEMTGEILELVDLARSHRVDDRAAAEACSVRGLRVRVERFYEGKDATTYRLTEGPRRDYALRIDTDLRSGRVDKNLRVARRLYDEGLPVAQPMDAEVTRHRLGGQEFSAAVFEWLPHAAAGLGGDDFARAGELLNTTHAVRPHRSPAWSAECYHTKMSRWQRLAERALDQDGHPFADPSLAFELRRRLHVDASRVLRYADTLQKRLGERSFLIPDWQFNLMPFIDESGQRHIALNDWQHHGVGPRHVDIMEAVGAVATGKWPLHGLRQFADSYGPACPPAAEMKPFSVMNKFNWMMWCGEQRLDGIEVSGPLGNLEQSIDRVLAGWGPLPQYSDVLDDMRDSRPARVEVPDLSLAPPATARRLVLM